MPQRPGPRQIERIRQMGTDLQKRRKQVQKIWKRIQFVIRWIDRLDHLLWEMRVRRFLSS